MNLNSVYSENIQGILQMLLIKAGPVHLQMMGRGQLKTVCGEESMNQLLVIDGVSVRQDNPGSYCLKDLHRTADGERRHEPSLWRNFQQTNELVQLLNDTGIPVSVIKSQPHFFESKFSEHLRLLETVH